MKLNHLIAVTVLTLAGLAALPAQGAPAATPAPEASPVSPAEADSTPAAGDSSQSGEVDLGDVVLQLQRISEQLARMNHDEAREKHNEYPHSGGGFFMPYRNFLDMGRLNTWLATQGSYAPLAANWFPFVNGWGGGWRWSMSENIQLGLIGWGGGTSSLGQRAASVYGSIDEDTDGLDDFYTYAGYGISVCDFQFNVRLPIDQTFTFNGGLTVGLGSDSFSISQNDRSLDLASGLGAVIGAADWSRFLLDLGASVSLQIQPDPETEWFKIGVNTGFDCPVPLTDWTPGTGVHVSESAPPADFLPMNYWASLSFDFNF